MSNIKKISVGQDSLVSYVEITLNSNGKWTSEYTLDEIKTLYESGSEIILVLQDGETVHCSEIYFQWESIVRWVYQMQE